MTGLIRRPEGLLKAESKLDPNVAILLSAVLWGTLWIPIRQLDGSGLGGPLAATAGFLLPLVLLLPVALRRGGRRMLGGGWALVAGGFCLALSVALYAEGVVRGHVARVILLFYLTPVWSTLLGRLLLGERITGRRVTTIALGLAGMVVIFGGSATNRSPAGVAEWMGLTAGLIWALAMVYVNRTAARPVLDRVLVQFVFLGPIFFLLTRIPGREGGASPELGAFLDSVPWLVAFAGLWILPAIGLTIFGASRLDPGRVAICLMLEVVVGLATATLLTAEPFGLRESIGATLIIGASAVEITARRGPRR
jgi:drug/metabolite transporter (DMT)-like permease